jgi:hypothetical protein
MTDVWCPICLGFHELPACDASWNELCRSCGQPIGGPAPGVPEGTCWRCHMRLPDEDRDTRYRRLLCELYGVERGNGE